MTEPSYNLICGDALQELKRLEAESVNLVLTDPPYNIGVVTERNGVKCANNWDRIENYIDWSIEWLTECQRVLKPNGVLYFWHNDMEQVAELLEAIRTRTSLSLVSFCIWDKGEAYRAKMWKNRDPNGATALRSWFNICEYCLHFFNVPKGKHRAWEYTGTMRINSNPECYKPLKEWYNAEKERLGLIDLDIKKKYTEATGKKPYMLRHYFQDSQFEIPKQEIWESVYIPLGFGASYEELRSTYEELRSTYEELRNVHHCDAMHCNIWHVPPLPSNNRMHTCQKPVTILERLINVSSNPGDMVLDCFMGSGSTGEAAARCGRSFIGIEMDENMFGKARERVEMAYAEGKTIF